MAQECCYQPGLMSFEDALETLLSKVAPLIETEMVSLVEADSRVIANTICSPINVPNYNNSAMDGYALRAADLIEQNTLALVGKSFAGIPYEGALGKGECIRIMTGAMMAEGADCVVMQEKTSQQGEASIGEVIEFGIKPHVGDHVRFAGEDIGLEQILFEPGHSINVANIGLLASLGFAEVEVFKKVKVAVFSSGDEIKQPGQALELGQIYDSNRFTNLSLLNRLGVEVKDLGCLPDNRDTMKQALIDANDWADVIITSGGVSVGEADFIKPIIEELGKIELWKIAIKPGKPFAYGKLSKAHFFGLPGNPVSALVTLYQLVVPCLQKMQGGTVSARPKFKAILDSNLKKSPGRKDFQRGVYFYDENHQLKVKTTGSQGSGILSSIGQANCFIVLEAAELSLNQGTEVWIEPFDKTLI